MFTTQVCIIGAGPAGTMAALRLSKDNIPFIIFDKENFPREKICGDALSGKVPHILRRLSPGIIREFEEVCKPLHSYGIRFIAPGNHVFDVPFIHDYDPAKHAVPGYTIRREVFDNFMLEQLKRSSPDLLHTACEVEKVTRTEGGFLIYTGQGVYSAKILIDASGARAGFGRPYKVDEPLARKTALAVRKYYEGVTGLHEQNFIELYFLDELLPGYFWIFPLPGGQVNAGVGIRKDVVQKKRINLSAVLDGIIASHPLVAPRFRGAKAIGKAAAYFLPLGNPRSAISGKGYMLSGDAAHLVDPLTGEGVGNALYSGYIAAEQAIDCLRAGRFDAGFIKNYDKRIKRVLGKEMKISANFQKMLKYKRMVKWIAKKADGNRHIPGLMSSMFTDLDHRKKLQNPFYLLRILLNR